MARTSSSTPYEFSLEVESEKQVISRNLGFQVAAPSFLKEDGNRCQNIWMGLSDDGNSILFRTPGQPIPHGGRRRENLVQ